MQDDPPSCFCSSGWCVWVPGLPGRGLPGAWVPKGQGAKQEGMAACRAPPFLIMSSVCGGRSKEDVKIHCVHVCGWRGGGCFQSRILLPQLRFTWRQVRLSSVPMTPGWQTDTWRPPHCDLGQSPHPLTTTLSSPARLPARLRKEREGTAQLALGSLKEAEVAGSGQAPGHALLSARWGRSPRAPVHSPFAWQQGSQDIREGTGTVEGGELRERVGEERGPVASGGKSPVQNWGHGKGR